MNVLFCTKQRKQLWEQRPGNYGKSIGKAPPNGGNRWGRLGTRITTAAKGETGGRAAALCLCQIFRQGHIGCAGTVGVVVFRGDSAVVIVGE